ncbi:MAG: hypothetical protein ACPGTO_04560 [Polaribacter sp.]
MKKYRVVTYKTLEGTKRIVKSLKKTLTKWVVYQDGKPKYHIDFYDIKTESNAILNSLVMCDKRPIREVLKIVSKKNNVNLSIPKTSFLGIKLKSEYVNLDLEPIPEEWLDYYL